MGPPLHYTLINNSTTREIQARKFTKTILSYTDYLIMKKVFEKDKRRKETTKGILLQTNLNKEEIKTFLDESKNDLFDINHTSSLKIIPTGNKISVKIEYDVFDFSKNIFNGQDHLSTEIILNFDNNQIFIESTNDKIIDKWQRKIIHIIQRKTNPDSFKEIEISLFGIQDPEKKLKFYSDLIENISEFSYETVVDIYVSRKKDSDSQDSSEEQEDTHSEDVNRYIKRASFKGSKLLDSETVLDLLKEHYHIYRIIWQSTNTLNSNETYQFEVKFNNPETCEDFAYSVHGKFIDGNTKITTISHEETKKITAKIFNKARVLMDDLNSELNLAVLNENNNDESSSNSK